MGLNKMIRLDGKFLGIKAEDCGAQNHNFNYEE